jgi:phage host-nuclease inhibitor protein Gam
MAKPLIVELKKQILNSQTSIELAGAVMKTVARLNGERYLNTKIDYNENAIIAEANSQYALADVLRLAHQRQKILNHLEAAAKAETLGGAV